MTAVRSSNVRLKSIALPVEHGGWAFLVEPILLGLLLAFSLPGFFLGVAATGVFLLYQPLQLAVKDYRKGHHYTRTTYAMSFAMLYALIALASWIVAAMTTQSWQMVIPLLIAGPLAVLPLVLRIGGNGRTATGEICAAVALGAVAPAIVLAAGWPLLSALTLWLLPAVRSATSILYVRIRLRQARQQEVSPVLTFAAHAAAILLTLGAIVAKLIPVGSGLVPIILLIRMLHGLFFASPKTPARVIGFQEIAVGLLCVFVTVVSYNIF